MRGTAVSIKVNLSHGVYIYYYKTIILYVVEINLNTWYAYWLIIIGGTAMFLYHTLNQVENTLKCILL